MIDFSQKIENIFSRLGIPTHAILLDPPGSGIVEVVFPMKRERDIRTAAQDVWPELAPFMGEQGKLLPRTILFHLAFELFGSISNPPQVFVSTNIRNLDNPTSRAMTLNEQPTLVTARSKEPGSSWEATVLTYDVDLILVAARPELTRPVAQQALEIATQFNQRSRLLKLGELSSSWSSSRAASVADVLKLESCPVPPGI